MQFNVVASKRKAELDERDEEIKRLKIEVDRLEKESEIEFAQLKAASIDSVKKEMEAEKGKKEVDHIHEMWMEDVRKIEEYARKVQAAVAGLGVQLPDMPMFGV